METSIAIFLSYKGTKTFHKCSLIVLAPLLIEPYMKKTVKLYDYGTIFSDFPSVAYKLKTFDEKQADLFFQVRRRAQNLVKGRAGKTRKKKKLIFLEERKFRLASRKTNGI
jgi:hypothetical protein